MGKFTAYCRARKFGRTVAKTISWRVFATVDTFVIGWVVTGSFKLAGAVIGFEVVTKFVWFAVHEHAWTHFGKEA